MRYYLRLTIEILIELVIYFLITKINEEKMLKIIIIILNSYLVYIKITNALKNKKQKNKIKSLNEKEKMIYNYYNLARENNEKSIKLKHDIKNQLQVVYVLCSTNQREGIKLLDEINQDLEKVNKMNYCKNDILNTILTIKIEEAKKHDINVKVKIDNLVDLKMEEIDICNMFSNLLDNSIEATRKSEDKLIEISVYTNKNYTVIKCENTYCNEILKDEFGNFKTTKKDKKSHVYGMKIIKDIVDKYKGEVNIKTKDKWFIVLIVL